MKEDTRRIIATTAGVAAATGIAFAAGKRILDGRSGRVGRNGGHPATVFHVKARDGVWVVESEDPTIPTTHHPTKGRAVRAGRKQANGQPPSRLVIHRGDGTVQRRHSYDPRA